MCGENCENCVYVGEIKDLQKKLAITEKALELACERVKYFEEAQAKLEELKGEKK